jgi:uncharacterized protein (UPF0548 family)
VLLTWSRDRRIRLLRRVADAPLTYPEVGATRNGTRPPGYDWIAERARIGTGESDFRGAAEGVLTWRVQENAGLGIAATSPRVAEGVVVLTTVGPEPLGIGAPCRVVWVVEEPRRVGFGYGTLRGHPEVGEEAFVVELGDDGRVWLEIRAFSRPATLLTRLAAPVMRLVQRRVIARYLAALIGTGTPSAPR